MSGKYILRDKRPEQVFDLMEWARAMQNVDRQVARTEVGDVTISTVFLGLDHDFTGFGPPILFETMIFGGEHDQYQDRYSSWSEAEAGHLRAVAIAKGEIEVER